MNKSDILHLLGWCSLIYFLFLLLWAVMFCQFHGWLYKTHGKWFDMSIEKFNSIHYLLMGIFKIIWLMFFLTPYIILRI